jgi:EAL domain-containing protein (putative c-di-GMP-specific phosphodiesterase class I)
MRIRQARGADREIGMAVVAEGVENVMQLETMIEVGCEFAQG